MSIRLKVWGDYALFTRPEIKVERVSYDVMTPSAARGLLEAIFWHPGMCWVVDRITVCKPIKFMNLRRNEIKATIRSRSALRVMNNDAGELYLSASNEIQQRASLLLRDVEYIIDAHFDMTKRASPTDNPGKCQDIIKHRIRKGKFYHQPCFGCREFPANFAPYEGTPVCPDELKGTKDLSFMLWDMDYSNPHDIRPLFFRAILEDGVLHVPLPGSKEVIG